VYVGTQPKQKRSTVLSYFFLLQLRNSSQFDTQFLSKMTSSNNSTMISSQERPADPSLADFFCTKQNKSDDFPLDKPSHYSDPLHGLSTNRHLPDYKKPYAAPTFPEKVSTPML
jgi:hypothetical protein